MPFPTAEKAWSCQQMMLVAHVQEWPGLLLMLCAKADLNVVSESIRTFRKDKACDLGLGKNTFNNTKADKKNFEIIMIFKKKNYNVCPVKYTVKTKVSCSVFLDNV